MRQMFPAVVALMMIIIVGCAPSIRYTHEEISDYPPEIQDRIRNGEISLGMTKMQVRYSWGGPSSIVVLPLKEGTKERVEWTYERFPLMKSRLIFTDDKLTDMITANPGGAK